MAARVKREQLDLLAIGLVSLLCALWGFQQVAVKVAVSGGLPPVLQAGVRSGIAALLLCGWVWLREGPGGLSHLLRRDATWRPGLVLGLVFGLEFLCLYPGLRLTTASRGVVFLYTAPFFTALGAHWFLPGERLRRRQALGLAIAFLGVAIAFADGLRDGGGSIAGDGLCLLAAIGWGINTVLAKASPALSRAPASKLLLFQLAGSAPLLLVASWAMGEMAGWPAASPLAWAGLAYQTAIVAFASYLVWFWLVLAYPAGRLSAFTFLTPLFGILAGALLLREQAGLPVLAGLVAIAGGLWLLNAAPAGVSARQAG